MARQLVPDPLIGRLVWPDALSRTLSPRGEFFPSRVEANAAASVPERSIELLLARLRMGRGLVRAETVAVPRRRQLTAPAQDIPFLDRVVLSALALELMRALEDDRELLALDLSLDGLEEGARRDFEQRPLQDTPANHFVLSDISAFYDNVDQSLLSIEIAELTGDVDLAEASAGVLHAVLGRRVGLPQGPRGADVLADFFLADIDRRMLRAGLDVDRLRDEYLLSASDRSSAQRALRVLEDALRERGLVLNPGKTHILTREAYEKGIHTKQERMARAAFASDPDTAIYGFDPEAFAEIDWSDLDVEHAEEVFDEALDADGVGFGGFGEGELARGLIALGGSGSSRPLDNLERLVDERPTLTREISFYLRQLIGTDLEADAVAAVIALIERDGFMHRFTEGWLLDFLARCEETFPAAFIDRLQGLLADGTRPWFARGRIAIALASERALPSQETLDELFARAPEPARADLTAAVELGKPSWRTAFRRGLGAGGPLLRFIPAVIEERGEHAI
jgi:hypothetical protein